MDYSFEKSLGRITHQVAKGIGEKLVEKFRRRGFDITARQWTVISFLKSSRKSNQKEIGIFLDENKVMTKRVLDVLQKKGYITRLPFQKDKRYNTIFLTPEGEKMYTELLPIAEETLEEVYAGFSKEEIEQCLDTLNRISKKLF